jgi:acyl-CoA synthetase (AMP-forming)/AMP-acid ligase II
LPGEAIGVVPRLSSDSPVMTGEETLRQSFGTIPDLIRAHAASRPDHPALMQDGRILSYRGLDALMDQVAAALQRDGVRPGDAVAVCAGTSIEYAALFLGSLRAGAAVAPLAPSATAESLVAMLANAEARYLFLDAPVNGTLGPLWNRFAAEPIALDNAGAAMHWEDWLAPPGTVPDAVDIRPDWPFNIIYSSGTTGAPKGIVQPHSMRWLHAQRGAMNGYGPDAVTLLSTPLYSNTTLVSFFPAMALGGTVVLMAKFDAAAYLALAEIHRATHTMLVPVQYQRIMAQPDFGRYDLTSFHMKFCTSAPFPATLKADILRRWPGGLIEYYGMTEGGGTCMLAAHDRPDKLHTVGTPVPGHDIRLIDEHGREVPSGETGEIVGHSGSMMTGYYRQAAQTAEAEWHDATGKRFIRTGDLGRFDKDGFLTLLDRKKDMIISGGFNVYPSDLEAVLREHADVAEVAVIGVPSDRWGETPVAFVVLKAGAAATEGSAQPTAGSAQPSSAPPLVAEGSAKPSAKELLAWANGRLGKTQRLAAVELIDRLPRSAIGKILKRDLRDAYKYNGKV